MLTLSITTRVLITGFIFIRLKTIWPLKKSLSKVYKTTLESIKISSFVHFIPVKFKIARIHTIRFPEFECSLGFVPGTFGFFNGESNYFHSLPNIVARKFNRLFFICGYNNLSAHHKIYNQIYQITLITDSHA